MLFKSAAVAALLPAAALACDLDQYNYAPKRLHARQVGGPVTPRTPNTYDWNYENQNWAAIKPEYATCGSGLQQSPIGLTTAQGLATTHRPDFSNVGATKVTGQFYNSGHGVYYTITHPEGDYTTLPRMVFDGETVYLTGWHTHTPSEHTVDGQKTPAEIHFVFYNAAGKPRSVVGFRIAQGSTTNPFLAQYPTPWPGLDKQNVQVQLTVDLNPLRALAQDFREYWTYQGSLTTPACNEGLRWFFLKPIFSVSAAQLAEIKRVGEFSARNVNAIKKQMVNV